jgi:hypothetical protein
MVAVEEEHGVEIWTVGEALFSVHHLFSDSEMPSEAIENAANHSIEDTKQS